MTHQFPIVLHLSRSGRYLPPRDASDCTQSLIILGELEDSLEAAQKALLARDLGDLERTTLEQKRCQLAFAQLWAPRPSSEADPETKCLALPAELQAKLERVLYLGRVQAALLLRAQRSLTALANLLAGPQAGYGPQNVGSWRGSSVNGERGDTCQA